jgi:hypothetical protein
MSLEILCAFMAGLLLGIIMVIVIMATVDSI